MDNIAEKGTIVKIPHQLILQDRNRLDLSGVSDVDSFDETVVTVYTSLGELTIKGKELHLMHLDLDSGGLSIEGKIDSLQYSETPSRTGVVSRLFR